MEAKQPTEQDKKKDTGVIIGIGVGGGVVVLIIIGVLVDRAVKKKHLKSLNQTHHKIDSDRLDTRKLPQRRNMSVSLPTLHRSMSQPPASVNAPPLSRRSKSTIR